MAEYNVGARGVGVYEKALVAKSVDTVVFADDLDAVEVLSDGSAAIYFTVDGDIPTVGGTDCFHLPALTSAREVPSNRVGVTVVKLISPGTPTYSVARVS